MSKFSQQIKPSDIPNSFGGQMTFSPLQRWSYFDEENYTILDIEDGTKKSRIRTPEEYAKEYDLGPDTAVELAKYQHAALNDLEFKIENLIGSSERYLQVKPYLDDLRYSRSLLFEYVALWNRSDQFTRSNFNPAKSLRTELLIGLTSYVLLGLFIAGTLLFLDGRSIDNNLPATLVALAWAYLTTHSLVKKTVPNFRTRRLILSLYTKNAR